MIELGLGLLSIGRRWGVTGTTPPSREEAFELLALAHRLGIRFYDTAPAYGESERVLGDAITRGVLPRADVTIATKAGEHYDPQTDLSRVDHSFAGLLDSVRRSLDRLGRIDILQLHKASAEAVVSSEVLRAFEAARGLGVSRLGASVRDIETGLAAISSGVYDWLQLPFNRQDASLLPVIEAAAARGVRIMTNRPFAMGALVANGVPDTVAAEAFRYVRAHLHDGVVLSGTRSPTHLRENVTAFARTAG